MDYSLLARPKTCYGPPQTASVSSPVALQHRDDVPGAGLLGDLQRARARLPRKNSSGQRTNAALGAALMNKENGYLQSHYITCGLPFRTTIKILSNTW